MVRKRRVVRLTEEECHSLEGETIDGIGFFNVHAKDGSGSCIIGEEEIKAITNPKALWLKELELVDYVEPLDTE